MPADLSLLKCYRLKVDLSFVTVETGKNEFSLTNRNPLETENLMHFESHIIEGSELAMFL